MHHDHTSCHDLSCGCHHVVFDLLILQREQANVPMKQPLKKAFSDALPEKSYIFFNGTIRPVAGGDSLTVYQAMAVKGNKIAGVGTYDEMKHLFADHQDDVLHIDLQEKCVIPGLIEPHVHIVPTAYTYAMLDTSPFDTQQRMRQDYHWQWVSEQLQKQASSLADESYWVISNGLDTSLLQPMDFQADLLTLVNNDILDEAVSDYPVFILSASGHTAYLNSKALAATWDYVDAPENQNKSGVIAFKTVFPTQDALYETRGVLQELLQMGPAVAAINPIQTEEMGKSFNLYMDQLVHTAHKRGITMFYDAAMDEASYSGLHAYISQRSLPALHIGMAAVCETTDTPEHVISQIGEFKLPDEETIDLYFGSIKLISDGSNQGLTGYQSQSYTCLPHNNYGICNYLNGGKQQISTTPPSHDTPKDLQNVLSSIGSSSWPIMTHANGDQAISYVLQGYDQIFKTEIKQSNIGEWTNKRYRIEHCSLLSNACIEQMSGVQKTYPSFLIGHVGFWGYAFENMIFANNDIDGKPKAECLDLCQTLWQKVNYITLHSDSPVSPIGPLRLMEQSVTRKLEGSPEAKLANQATGELFKSMVQDIPVLNRSEKLTPAQALTAATYNAAWQCHAEHLVGSLEAGKLADFAILDHDPLMLGNDDACYLAMRAIKVDELWVKGKRCDFVAEQQHIQDQQ